MEKVSKFLTSYVIKKEIIGEDDREIYEYGFTITIEMGIFVVLCLMIMAVMHMYLEGVLFFVIFFPLRSYAGGLHLNKYYACLILSTLTFWGVMVVGRMIPFPILLACVLSYAALLGIYMLYPVENENRKVDQQEDVYFRRRLKIFLAVDAVLIAAFYMLDINRGLWIIAVTLTIVVVTMLVGKCKNRIHSSSTEEK